MSKFGVSLYQAIVIAILVAGIVTAGVLTDQAMFAAIVGAIVTAAGIVLSRSLPPGGGAA